MSNQLAASDGAVEAVMAKQNLELTRLIPFILVFGLIGAYIIFRSFASGPLNVKINFQPANTPVPAGYLADNGKVFGDRGNGYAYGWATDNAGNMRDRDATSSPDQRYDTFAYTMSGGNNTWEMTIPNGLYKVRLVAGDPYKIDSFYKFSVENVLALNGAPTSTNHWLDNTVSVNVTDGKITITNAIGAVNNRLNFVEISAVSSLAANSVTSAPVIDGNLNEASWQLDNYSSKTVLGASQSQAAFGATWDNSYLYVGIKVTDANLRNDSVNGWDDDSVEVYIDAGRERSTVYDANDRQFSVVWNSGKLAEMNNRTTGVVRGIANITGGYSVELAVPWTNLGITPTSGMAIGFDVGINDDSNGGARDGQKMWAGMVNNYKDTSNFGTLVLAGSPTPPTAISFSASPSSIAYGASATLIWSATNATSCTASGAWSGTKATSGSQATGALSATTSYSLTCTGSSGAQSSATVTVGVAPQPSPGSSIYWGAWMDGGVYGSGVAPWDTKTWNTFESHAGKKASIVHFGYNRKTPWEDSTFHSSWYDLGYNRGELSLQDIASWDYSLADIANGVYDSGLKNWATGAKNYGKPIFLRWNWEMNGTWFGWGAQAQKNPAVFVSSWKHMHDVFVAQGATNITWVWCPNTEYSGSTSLDSLYPGDSYVDWTCIDGYNFPTDSYRSFTQIFTATYNHILKIAPSKPMMIGETASTEKNGSKATWITNTLGSEIKNFPSIKAFVWFNWNISENGTTRDWAIETSSTAQAAFAKGISSSYFATNSFYSLPALKPIPPIQ